MGWSSGSPLMIDIIGIIKKKLKNEEIRERIYKDLIVCFEDMDCDTLDECVGTDKVFLKEIKWIKQF